MSSGDLLFISAFIILPTVILVSCVWALWLIRAGVLLPPRRERAQHSSTHVNAADEHVVPPDSETADDAPVAPLISVIEESVHATANGFGSAHAVDVDTPAETPALQFQMTTDLPVITPEAIAGDALAADSSVEQAESFAEADDALIAEAPHATPAPAPSEVPPFADNEVLFIPLDPDEADNQYSARGDDMAETYPESQQPAERTVRKPAGTGMRRKPARRVAQLRPTDVSQPRGTVLRRARSKD